MADGVKKRGLGKGLEALISVNRNGLETAEKQPISGAVPGSMVITIPLSRISSNPRQPRKRFEREKVAEMADSIREYGVIQPIVVREDGSGGYQVVTGERRLLASREAGLTEIPAILREFEDPELLPVALVENLQRKDLNPIEVAQALKVLIDEFGFTQEEIGRKLGMSRSAVANTLRLLELEPKIRLALEKGELTAGHGRALLSVDGKDGRAQLFQEIVKKGSSVRAAEKAAKKIIRRKKTVSEDGPEPSKYQQDRLAYRAVEQQLEEAFGTRVQVQPGSTTGGKVVMFYESVEDMNRILELLLNVK
jgi:ParB family chromosome partitioning protein